MSKDIEESKRISVELPVRLIEKFDHLKHEWGLRGRGAVLKRILLELLENEESINDVNSNDQLNIDQLSNKDSKLTYESEYNENTALVLIGNKQRSSNTKNQFDDDNLYSNKSNLQTGIDLPGFIRNKARNINVTLNKSNNNNFTEEPIHLSIKEIYINKSISAAHDHWINLYGNKPGVTVIEASMIWLGRDIWPHLDGTNGQIFTWTNINSKMKQYCPYWKTKEPSLELVITIAGLLEDPFSSVNLPDRVPTLIRRFVNRFKKSRNVNSFETLESTMTVHGALKLLGLPTKAGASLTLSRIRDSYKSSALASHPDSGGSTDQMRRVNEAYQLLKELYRK